MNPPPSLFVCGSWAVLSKRRGVRGLFYGSYRLREHHAEGKGLVWPSGGEECDWLRRLLVRFGA